MDSEQNRDIEHQAQRAASRPASKPAGAVYGARGATPENTCAPAQLHVCFHCAGELVYPLDWSEEGPRHWRIVLRCPECESRREGVFDQAAVERLDDELDRGSSALLGDLRRMTHANMSEEIEFFARALDADLILPSDF
ncbi:MAG TPA: hypothetical protein VKV16_05795 [Solirubrobacteraceae bacterium]|nr:hypothetical protein [Solirubrobacteraceae bacterium]